MNRKIRKEIESDLLNLEFSLEHIDVILYALTDVSWFQPTTAEVVGFDFKLQKEDKEFVHRVYRKLRTENEVISEDTDWNLEDFLEVHNFGCVVMDIDLLPEIEKNT